MPKAKRNIGLEILQGLRELKRGDYGRVTTVPSVTNIREKTGLSQARFAQLLGVSVRTLQDWEQGRRAPSSNERQDLDLGANLMHRPDLGQRLGLVVASLDVHVRADRANQFGRGVLVEQDRVIDDVQRADQRDPI